MLTLDEPIDLPWGGAHAVRALHNTAHTHHTEEEEEAFIVIKQFDTGFKPKSAKWKCYHAAQCSSVGAKLLSTDPKKERRRWIWTIWSVCLASIFSVDATLSTRRPTSLCILFVVVARGCCQDTNAERTNWGSPAMNFGKSTGEAMQTAWH